MKQKWAACKAFNSFSLLNKYNYKIKLHKKKLLIIILLNWTLFKCLAIFLKAEFMGKTPYLPNKVSDFYELLLTGLW